MAIFSKNRWLEPYHWLTGRRASPSSQAQQVSSTQSSSQLRESSPHEIAAGSEDSMQPHQGSYATSGQSGDENPVEDEYLRLNKELTPSTPNAEPESSHPVRQRRKAAEEDPWTASLERSGGVDYYASVSSTSGPSKRSCSPINSNDSVYHDAEEVPSQKKQAGPTIAQCPAKSGSERSNDDSGSSEPRDTHPLE